MSWTLQGPSYIKPVLTTLQEQAYSALPIHALAC